MRRGWSLITYPRAGIFPTVCRFDLGSANESILPTLLKSSTKNFVLGREKQEKLRTLSETCSNGVILLDETMTIEICYCLLRPMAV